MASGVPASDKRGASQPRRVDGVPALGMRPQQVPAAPDRRSTRRTTREFIPVTARVNKKKGHSPRLYYAPCGREYCTLGTQPLRKCRPLRQLRVAPLAPHHRAGRRARKAHSDSRTCSFSHSPGRAGRARRRG